MTRGRTAPDLADRYGLARPGRRRAVVVASAVVAVLAGGWLVWTAWFHGSPQATSQLVSWEVLDAEQVEVSFDVSLDEGVVAQCRVEALNRNKAAVGSAVVVVPTDAGDADGGRITTTFRTTSEATAVDLVGCTTPDQRRPR
ncbi:DUF4307 domain-containing protein [Nocardioides zeae]|uniref:DUF4307 domain-containing protein n=1 Tax=Nocardioides imazamoxiresistens TaxID=3231893 RepID=A0ABU3PYN1_9ACTN|nr:DUF4307 domain-containing protein [Nocardioides zeae]MDT9594358.1 DUF4307 domain-containing protein [Nocardioides zeae]